jgi:phosphohistidine phosphatase SixA
MTIYLLRHARAGRRRDWKDDDDLRPLTKIGRRQAAAIAQSLAGAGIERIVTSPYVRCRESVEPLAARLRLPVDLSEALSEGSALHEVLRLIEKVSDQTTVLCTHGDVIEAVLEHLRASGISLGPHELRPPMEKGSAWALETHRGEIVGASYQPRPKPV